MFRDGSQCMEFGTLIGKIILRIVRVCLCFGYDNSFGDWYAQVLVSQALLVHSGHVIEIDCNLCVIEHRFSQSYRWKFLVFLRQSIIRSKHDTTLDSSCFANGLTDLRLLNAERRLGGLHSKWLPDCLEY